MISADKLEIKSGVAWKAYLQSIEDHDDQLDDVHEVSQSEANPPSPEAVELASIEAEMAEMEAEVEEMEELQRYEMEVESGEEMIFESNPEDDASNAPAHQDNTSMAWIKAIFDFTRLNPLHLTYLIWSGVKLDRVIYQCFVQSHLQKYFHAKTFKILPLTQ